MSQRHTVQARVVYGRAVGARPVDGRPGAKSHEGSTPVAFLPSSFFAPVAFLLNGRTPVFRWAADFGGRSMDECSGPVAFLPLF